VAAPDIRPLTTRSLKRRLTVVALIILAFALLAALARATIFRPAPGFISWQQYQSARTGAPETDVNASLGPPVTGLDFQDLGLPDAPQGMRCEYYAETNSVMDGDTFRFCYAGGRLANKGAYLPGGQPATGP
jgi:hypothetical protein